MKLFGSKLTKLWLIEVAGYEVRRVSLGWSECGGGPKGGGLTY